jgi:hypothetical protein
MRTLGRKTSANLQSLALLEPEPHMHGCMDAWWFIKLATRQQVRRGVVKLIPPTIRD